MQVLQCGAKVKVGPLAEIEAHVIRIEIGPALKYLISWWDGNQLRTEWMHPWELTDGDRDELTHVDFQGD
jgi:hypothetical protein